MFLFIGTPQQNTAFARVLLAAFLAARHGYVRKWEGGHASRLDKTAERGMISSRLGGGVRRTIRSIFSLQYVGMKKGVSNRRV